MGFEVKKYTDLSIIQAVLFMAIPFVLWAQLGVQLPSISAYAYYTPLSFSFMLTMAGSLFFYNGYSDRSKWFEMVLGSSLWLVVLFPHLDWPVLHYAFAGVFFLGSCFNMIFFSSGKYRAYMILIAFLLLLAMVGTFFFQWYTIYWAEFLGMAPISAHKVLEQKKIID